MIDESINLFLSYIKNINTNNTIISNILNGYGLKSFYEMIYITCFNPITLQCVYNYYKSIQIFNIYSLNNYVSFNRLNIGFLDKLSCDWCSIVNGIARTSLDSLKYLETNYYYPPNISTDEIDKLYNGLIRALFLREKLPDENEYKEYIIKNFNTYLYQNNEYIIKTCKILVLLEYIELRWCPFKAMVNYYYRNDDIRYIYPSNINIKIAGYILSNHETIDCYLCNLYINNSIKQINYVNPISPLYDYYFKLLDLEKKN